MTPPGDRAPAVEIRGLTIRYGDIEAVRDVDLDVPAGGLTALVGPSGCGKTSLLRAVAGFEMPHRGSIRIAGQPVARPGHWTVPEKRRVGMVFQQGALFPHLSVWRNVIYGLKNRHDRDRHADRALQLVGMATRRDRYPDELSGGEQQRVALARALAPEPSIILLDEPFASLDAALRRHLRQEVRSILQQAGTTAVLVTHDQREALSVADTVVVMTAGEVLQVGSPGDVYRRPANLEVARVIGEGQLIACEAAHGQARSLLGTVACDGAHGRGLLLVRPEDLVVTPVATGAGSREDLGGLERLEGRVARRHFFGHDLIDEVELTSGEMLRVRELAPSRVRVGEPVMISLRDGVYRAFPATGEVSARVVALDAAEDPRRPS